MPSNKRWLVSVSVSLACSMGTQAAEEPQLMPGVQVEEVIDPYRADVAMATTKSDTPLQDVPQSITVMTRQSLDDIGAQNIGDAMYYVPGVGMAQGEGNRETPVIRGSSSTGDFFLDGMRDDVQYYRDLYNIEQVEVLKGPNGAIFGRGGVAGLINRVSKEAGWSPIRQFTGQLGTDNNLRTAVDVGGAVGDSVALRFNGMYENSDSYRDDVTLERYGINPTMTWRAGAETRLTLGLEYFRDERIADRGVSSYQGKPLDVDAAEFFGDPAQSPTDTTVKMANAMIEHRFSDTMRLRNRTRYGDYDKFYQNVFPGATNASGTTVSISAYNNATTRTNFFNQTDFFLATGTGSIRHKFLIGAELGQQDTENFRNTGYFDSVAVGTTSVSVPVSNPRTTLPVTFRQNATDADNAGTAKIAALYVQDEISFTPQFIVTAGLRYDNFRVDFDNHRTGANFKSDDNLFSPRVGLVYKATDAMSLYGNYSIAYQPRAGDQLASLSLSNSALDPEEFVNYEAGVKWSALENLAMTAALFRIERSNVAVADPQAGQPGGPPAGTLMLVDGQRNQGLELSLAGSITDRWTLIGSYAYQDGEIVTTQSATVAKGATLANLPKNTFSLWNRYNLTQAWGIGLGVIYKDDMFAATQNLTTPTSNVVVPSFTRVDAAIYYTPSPRLRAQINLENVLDNYYHQFANSNTNITPGSPFAVRGTVTLSF
jgi:catecholate siderophore receptor